MLSRIREKMHYKKYSPLIYNDELKEAYMGTSVAGGSLNGKTVLITGGTGDIGTSLALRFIDEQCKVIISGRNAEKLEKTKKFLEDKRCRATVNTLHIDLLQLDTIEDKLDSLYDRNDKVDILISNAGFVSDDDRKGAFRTYDLDMFSTSWNTNFQGNANVCKYIAKKMDEYNIEGSIIAISSICSQQKKMQYTPYGMSKAALHTYADLLHEKYPKLNIKTICPGSVATKMNNIAVGNDISGGCNNQLNHLALPEEISALAVFLCSDCGMYITSRGGQ
jgi:short-subunit dehydrogenase